jgi:ribosomal protein L40E
MVKICPECGAENEDYSFWCSKCNTKLLKTINKKQKPTEEKKQPKQSHTNDLLYSDNLKRKEVFTSMLKIPLILIIIAGIIFSSYYFITNIGETNFNWENYGGCPWNAETLPWENNDFPWVKSLSIDDVFNAVTTTQSFTDVGEINVDYWFNGNEIITTDGWTFTVSKVQEFSYTARVLGYQIYNKDDQMYNPTETFSQIDIFLGFEDLIDNPDKYPYTIISYFYRGVYCDYKGSDYFSTHCTNTHIIPHSATVLNKLKTISLDDVVTMSGYYVNVHGTHKNGRTTYSWTTDTVVGNHNCEIILLDSIQFQ